MHFIRGETVAVVNSGGEFAADFALAADGDAALLIGLRARCGIVRIVLHEDVDTFLHTKTAAVGSGDGEVNNFFGGVVDVIARFQFQGAVTGHFKAAIADFIGVRVAGIGITGREFADFRSVFAFGDFIGAEADVGRGMVGRSEIRAIIEDIHGEGVVRGTSRLSGHTTDDADGRFLFAIVCPQAEVVLRIGFIEGIGNAVTVGIKVGIGFAIAVGVDIYIQFAVAISIAADDAWHIGGTVILRLVEDHRSLTSFGVLFEQGFNDGGLLCFVQALIHGLAANFGCPDFFVAVAIFLHDLFQGFFARGRGDDIAIHQRPAV